MDKFLKRPIQETEKEEQSKKVVKAEKEIVDMTKESEDSTIVKDILK